MNAYDCPNCGSSNTQSFDNVHSSNVRSSYGGTRGSFESWNQLAAQTAPPANPHVGCGSVVAIFVLTLVSFGITAAILSAAIEPFAGMFTADNKFMLVYFPAVIAGVAVFIGGLLFVSKRVQKRMPDYQQKADEWNRSMLCRRCGYRWLRG